MIGKILVFGDSIGQGYYDEKDGGWVRLLQRDFFNEYYAGKREVHIINLSVSGHTSQEVVERIEQETKARCKDEKILTVIAIGINDSFQREGARRTSMTDFTHNIKRIIEIAKSFGDVVVCGLTSCVDDRVGPTGWDAGLVYTNAWIKEYDAVIKREAEDAGVLFVPLWQATYDAQMAIETMPDGIHPNAAGHEVIYNKMKKIMEKML
ncbi:hypothetical protein KBD87_02700 [Candidatus Saccharibacteria bacterium]|nr:hypothetical protein [Candidatus Saccharibacteria bacterium]